eukprot:TRINITY_DN14493_c0_g1_i1.p1 TRINITY_DN14493_c0_g1~~TRINITY_DN14493_c0_g1_i1.p1  ORF type:complete len:358 (+),score=108.33 TRINITY_DN14493_c0_g1_i1:36-1076(+)
MALNLFAPLSEQKKDSLIEFKAGKLNKDPNSKWVRPDKRKGLIQLRQKDDQILHFIWKDRVTGAEEHDLMIFPDDAVWRKVKESNDRVYVLEFKTNDKKLFFWMQEPSAAKDDQIALDLNKFMNNPPQPGGSGLEGLGNMDQQQLLQMLSQGGGGSAGLGNLLRGLRRPQATPPTPSTPTQLRPAASSTPAASSGSTTASSGSAAAGGSGNTISLSFLQNALANAQRNAQSQQNTPSLNDVVDVEHIVASGLFNNEEVVKKLAEYLPEGTPVTAENMKDNVNSPQFKQAISMFNEALRTGELATIMASFGLEAKDIGPNATIEDFLKAIQNQAQKDKVEGMETEKQ